MRVWFRSTPSLEFVVCVSALAAAIPLCGQTVLCERGNIIYKDKGGRIVKITSSGFDADPEISKDGKRIVWRTPYLKIDTGLGDTDANELWVAGTSGNDQAERILVGHSGGYAMGENMVLAGFSRPQFSPDGGRIYFIAQTWATASSIRVLDVKSSQVRFIAAGLSVEVLQSGQYAGHLIVRKAIPLASGGRTFRYWLVDADGKELGEIGEKASDVEQFKEESADQN